VVETTLDSDFFMNYEHVMTTEKAKSFASNDKATCMWKWLMLTYSFNRLPKSIDNSRVGQTCSMYEPHIA